MKYDQSFIKAINEALTSEDRKEIAKYCMYNNRTVDRVLSGNEKWQNDLIISYAFSVAKKNIIAKYHSSSDAKRLAKILRIDVNENQYNYVFSEILNKITENK